MAVTKAKNKYVSILNGTVNSVFLGSELQEYNETQIDVRDVTALKITPKIGWIYDAINDVYYDPQDPSLLTLAQVKERKNLEIDNARAQHLLPSNIQYMGHQFDLTVETYTNLAGAAAFAALIGDVQPGFAWVDYDNNLVPMNLNDLKGFAALVASTFQNGYAHAAQLKIQVDAATTKEEVDAIPNW